jgi:hypothetical protein
MKDLQDMYTEYNLSKQLAISNDNIGCVHIYSLLKANQPNGQRRMVLETHNYSDNTDLKVDIG